MLRSLSMLTAPVRKHYAASNSSSKPTKTKSKKMPGMPTNSLASKHSIPKATNSAKSPALNPPAHDYLIVREPDGILTKVPFVKAIVTEVDLDDNCVIIDAPAGLFSDAELEID